MELENTFYRARPIHKNFFYISTLFLFPVTINLLLRCYLVYTARTRSCTQPCRVDGLLRTQLPRPVKHGRVYGPSVYTIVYTTVQMDEYTVVYGRCNGHETSGHAVTV